MESTKPVRTLTSHLTSLAPFETANESSTLAIAHSFASLPSSLLFSKSAIPVRLTGWLPPQIVKGVAGGKNIQEAAASELKPESLVGPGLRESAARSLLAFLGAARGSLYSVNAFLEEVFRCYRCVHPLMFLTTSLTENVVDMG